MRIGTQGLGRSGGMYDLSGIFCFAVFLIHDGLLLIASPGPAD
jgi:hypothetical protein